MLRLWSSVVITVVAPVPSALMTITLLGRVGERSGSRIEGEDDVGSVWRPRRTDGVAVVGPAVEDLPQVAAVGIDQPQRSGRIPEEDP